MDHRGARLQRAARSDALSRPPMPSRFAAELAGVSLQGRHSPAGAARGCSLPTPACPPFASTSQRGRRKTGAAGAAAAAAAGAVGRVARAAAAGSAAGWGSRRGRAAARRSHAPSRRIRPLDAMRRGAASLAAARTLCCRLRCRPPRRPRWSEGATRAGGAHHGPGRRAARTSPAQGWWHVTCGGMVARQEWWHAACAPGREQSRRR